ncbi:MAG: 30S ribosomal protein S6 [Nitrospira sp.]|nr:30S ribosomal protein S6 [bacterium]MBL7048301.1 30S ribosomal protein S6 [Nitrospira sp.]
MNYYEMIVIIDSRLDDSAAQETVTKMGEVITQLGGEIFKTENWGHRKLAYELNKHQKGNYFLLQFKTPPETIAKLERFTKITDAVIKMMVVRLVKKQQIDAILPKAPEAVAEPTPTDEVPETSQETVSVDAGADAGVPAPEEG